MMTISRKFVGWLVIVVVMTDGMMGILLLTTCTANNPQVAAAFVRRPQYRRHPPPSSSTLTTSSYSYHRNNKNAKKSSAAAVGGPWRATSSVIVHYYSPRQSGIDTDTAATNTVLFYQKKNNNETVSIAAAAAITEDHSSSTCSKRGGQVVEEDAAAATHRFERTATNQPQVDQPCVLTIDGIRYNVTAWAKAHPGGVGVLQKFRDKDATKAFYGAHHSAAAIELLQTFAILDNDDDNLDNSDNKHATTTTTTVIAPSVTTTTTTTTTSVENSNSNNKSSLTVVSPLLTRWRAKLFTKEDPVGIHKYLGVFVLLHFVFRFFQMLCTDPSAGLGTRMGKGPSWIPVLCLIPHGLLSLSSLIFHTVPKDRVVGKPMIWQEYRIHNIGFGLRSVLCAALAAVSIHVGHTATARRVAVWGSSAACVAALVGADLATHHLRANQHESTTATMPYWDGCSVETQKRFKSFYAYCQFLATLGCLTVTNPAWPLSILLAIQLASLLMTLVRKGLLSARGYHLAYTAALIAPYVVALRSAVFMKTPDVFAIFALGGVLYQLRRRNVNKYALWLPVIAARIAVGDKYLNWAVW